MRWRIKRVSALGALILAAATALDERRAVLPCGLDRLCTKTLSGPRFHPTLQSAQVHADKGLAAPTRCKSRHRIFRTELTLISAYNDAQWTRASGRASRMSADRERGHSDSQ